MEREQQMSDAKFSQTTPPNRENGKRANEN